MDNIVTRIMEIEQKCAEEIQRAEQKSDRKIEAHKQMLEGKKTEECSQILTAGNIRAAQAVEEAKKRIESESSAATEEYEGLYQDPRLREEIKERIVSILLAS